MPSLSALNSVLPLIGVLIGAGLQFIFGKTLESRKQLSLQKGQAYADYFRAMSAAGTQGSSKETLALATDAKTRVCIYGSPEVVSRLGDFERAGAIVASGDGQAAVVRLLKAMRKDVGVANEALLEDDLRHALFGRGGSLG